MPIQPKHKQPVKVEVRPRGSKFLSSKERQSYDAVPQDIGHEDLARYFHLTPEDIALIRVRGDDSLRLGMALRLCVLRWTGRYPSSAKDVPLEAINHVRQQLGITKTVIAAYPTAGQTAERHRKRIVYHLGYREYDEAAQQVETWLEGRLREHDFARAHLDDMVKYLQQEKILRPGLSTLEALLTTVRKRVDDETYRLVVSELSSEQRARYQTLFEIPDEMTVTKLQWLKQAPPHAQAAVLVSWLQGRFRFCAQSSCSTQKYTFFSGTPGVGSAIAVNRQECLHTFHETLGCKGFSCAVIWAQTR
jgi:hypothetical protein